jgi:D-alanyl-lipoteichoic acid acyltransferase DltB (MBOAT superfamily)
MIFTEISFLIFCIVFFAGHAMLRGRARGHWLLICSYYFYGSWDYRFLSLLIGSTLVDFWVSHWITRTEDRGRRRQIMLLSVAFNLGVLCVFKYAGFFVDSAVSFSTALGLPISRPAFDIVLPVGISFYTFQTLGYTLDVYWRRQEAPARLLDFALYVAFFPQLVAGPIERASHLLPQMVGISSKPWRPDPSGIGLVSLGLFKKVVLADGVRQYVGAYSDVGNAYPAAIWFATYAFAYQIYWDFSGYSDIAVGLSRLLGVDLVANFRAPYAALGPSDFWRRWHVSLSAWLRDYLYVPLGGNRSGTWRTYRNLFLTMLLGGLWHGAAWNFVLWGAFHGVLLVGARLLTARFGWREDKLPWLRVVVFFHVTCFGWALFRASSLEQCGLLWRKLALMDGLELRPWLEHLRREQELVPAGLWLGVFIVAGALQYFYPRTSSELVATAWRAPVVARALVVAGLFFVVMLLSPLSPPAFVYFQF